MQPPSTNTSDDDDFAARLREAIALPDAPSGLVRAAVALWPEHGIGVRGGVRRLLAVLRFDSAAAAPGGVLATRSAASAAAAARHLLFSVDGRDIDLRVTPAGGLFMLTGQVLGPDDSGLIQVATLADAQAVVGSGTLNALGEFSIDGIAPGCYDLLLTLGSDEITLPAVEVGRPGADSRPG